jgi:type I restriction enzyme S subunit
MSELPTGWAQTTLSEIAAWGSGGTPSRSEPSYYGGGIPWIKTGELGPRFVSSTEESISVEGLSNSSAKLFPAGSVAIAMYGATIGKTSILGIPATTNQACAVGIPHFEVTTKEYLYHFLCSQKEAFVEAGKGGAQPNISQAIIKDWKLPLAPLPEQKCIADKLDSVLARVDACRDRLDRLPALLKRFRRSILDAATSGRLTKDWRNQPESSITDNPTTPASWTICKIKDAGKIQLGRQRSPKFHSGENMLPYLRVQNVFEDRLDLSDVMSMDFPGEDFERYQLHPGDILLNEGQSPEYLGRPAMYRGELPGACFTNTLIRFQAYSHVKAEYALMVFRSHMHSGRYITEGTITTNIAHLGAGRFSEVEFPLPPQEEQTEIVRRVEILFAFADRLDARLATARRQVGQLTPALLAKAFRGELVAQDPADEPAAELLKRLAAQREVAPKVKRGRAKK